MTLVEPHAPTTVADLGAGCGPEWVDRWLAEHAADVVGWRRSLHAHPELGRREHETTRLCLETLERAGLRPRRLPGGTGLICDVGQGPVTVGLRADLDALPLTEQNDLPFASRVPGVAHMCGHDAHTAMLLGAGLALASAPTLPGREIGRAHV